MGGRGMGGGSGMGSAGGGSVSVASEMDVWSYRHNPNNEPFVDAINEGVAKIQNDFPGVMNDVNFVNAATLNGIDKVTTLGFYSRADKSVSLNTNFTDIDKMNKVYDRSTQSGFHPSRGNLSGTEAVAIHEMGHALTGHLAEKAGKDFDSISKEIVKNAYKATGGKSGTKSWAKKISGYASTNNAECIAEAVADWYCNGSKAHSHSKAIMAELKKY